MMMVALEEARAVIAMIHGDDTGSGAASIGGSMWKDSIA